MQKICFCPFWANSSQIGTLAVALRNGSFTESYVTTVSIPTANVRQYGDAIDSRKYIGNVDRNSGFHRFGSLIWLGRKSVGANAGAQFVVERELS